jgi:Response regulator containing a CheY-like receiver domain and an HTH DNA-binding domain
MSADLRLVPPPVPDREPSTPSPIRVALVDDHVLMRRSLRLLLEGEEGIEVVAEADSLELGVRQAEGGKPNVLVLDYRIPDGLGAEAIGKLRRRAPGTGVVVITMHDNPAFAAHVIAAGALGFVRKELSDSELPQAVRAAARGEVYVSPQVAERPDGSA